MAFIAAVYRRHVAAAVRPLRRVQAFNAAGVPSSASMRLPGTPLR